MVSSESNVPFLSAHYPLEVDLLSELCRCSLADSVFPSGVTSNRPAMTLTLREHAPWCHFAVRQEIQVLGLCHTRGCVLKNYSWSLWGLGGIREPGGLGRPPLLALFLKDRLPVMRLSGRSRWQPQSR